MEDRRREFGTFARLSGMMFLQFAIWGAWAVLIAGHMQNLGFSGKQISYVFGTTAIGSIISPYHRWMDCGSFNASTSVRSDFSSTWGCLSLYCVEADLLPNDVEYDFSARRSLYADHRTDQRDCFSPHGTIR